MSHSAKFSLNYSPETFAQLEAIERKHHRLIKKKIVEQLSYTPQIETRNRKSLEQPAPFGATWELRFGPKNCFRVFYEVNSVEQEVLILAIGVKTGNQLYFSGEEFIP